MKYLLLALFALIPSIARGGAIALRDGKSVSGDVKFTDGKLLLTEPGKPTREIPLEQVMQVSFTAEPAAPVAVAEDPIITERTRKERAKERSKTGKAYAVLAEYFDPAFQKRLAVQLQATPSGAWSTETPDPAVPAYCAVRYTARFVPKQTGDHVFAVEAHGPVKLVIAGKTLISGESKVGVTPVNPIQLTANQPVDMVLEVTAARWGFRSGLSCRGPAGGNTALTSESFVPPANMPPAATVTLTGPPDGMYIRLPAPVTFTADAAFPADTPAGKIAKVEFIIDKTVIGESTKPPYTFDWKQATAGYHRVTAKVITADGISQLSAPRYVAIAGQGKDQSIPAPWGEQTVFETRREAHPVGSASFKDGVYTLTKAGGQIADGDDECHFVHQPVKGDFQLTARLISLTPADPIVGPVAGIIIKDHLNGEGKFAAALVTAQSVIGSKRSEGYMKTSNTERLVPLPAGAKQIEGSYLRIQRYGSRVRSFTSKDGKEWEILSNDRIAFGEQLYVGLCAMSRNLETPAVAAFDHVELTLGAPEMSEGAAGLLFTNGTFLACNVSNVKEGRVYYSRAGAKQTMPIADVARIVYRPISAELAKSLPEATSGILLASGDFAEGQIKEVSYHVTISSLVFGPRTFAVKGGETVLAVVFKDPAPPKIPPRYTLTANDGSVYHSESIKPSKDNLAIQDAMLGAIDLPANSIAEIRANQ